MLTENEKKVLYGMVRYPTLNDRELSEKIKVRIPTITAIRRRLKERGFYSVVRIPCVQKLGCEILTVGYSNFKESLFEDAFVLGFHSNYTNYRRAMESVDRLFVDRKTSTEGFRYVIFPFELSRVINFFDCSHILARHFRLRARKEQKLFFEGVEHIKLRGIEEKVLYALVKYPDLPDIRIAQHFPVSRHSISKMRKQFEEAGIIKTLVIPNLEQLGYQILAFTHIKLNLSMTMEEKESQLQSLISEIPHILFITNNSDAVIATVFKDFREYQLVMRRKVFEFLKKKGVMEGEPVVLLHSIPDIKMLRNHNYAPLIKKIFSRLKREPYESLIFLIAIS